MVTRHITTTSLFGALAALLSACSGGVAVESTSGTPPNNNPSPTIEQPVPPAPDLAYPGKGFVVHEWGTDTVVVGSDGSLQRGLHHEEEDLPAFVYDRIKAGSLAGATSVHVKMETPVAYFYSDTPLTANVSVGFPRGVLTQWYPAVRSFYPFIAGPNAVAGMPDFKDPALDPSFPFTSEVCSEKHGAIANGLLDWGPVEILPRGESPSVPDAPLDAFTWSHAREVSANAVRVKGDPSTGLPDESERFLFYRGLGDFELPVAVTADPTMNITAKNTLADPVGTVFVVNVGHNGFGFFTAVPAGIAPKGEITVYAHHPGGRVGLHIEEMVEALGAQVTDALDATGLYHDEAVAMVNTWKRQWFRTPGLRLLYLAPQAWTESSIPLTVDPKPEGSVRVMMIRVEIITPALEEADVAQVQKLAGKATEPEARAYFKALGRFAEPRLRRAMALLGDAAYAEPLLAEIASAATSVAAGE